MHRTWVGIVVALTLGCESGGTGGGSGGSGNSSGGSSGSAGSGGSSETGCDGGTMLSLVLFEDGVRSNRQGPLAFVATVTASGEHSLVLETCPSGGSGAGGAGGATGCDDDLRLEIDAPELGLPVATGTSVDVEWDQEGGGGTARRAMVVLRDRGDETTGGFLLGITSGSPMPTAPFSVVADPLRCEFEPPSGPCGSRTAYALVFAAAGDSAPSVRLTMGQSGDIELEPDARDSWRAHNVRAYTSGACDAFDPHLYYVVRNAR